MTNEQIISKMKDDMKMRGFSHWTEDSYLGKTKYIMKYFNKPREKVETEELMKEIKTESNINDSVLYFICDS